MVKSCMLIVDLYSLLPAFTLGSLLIILLWPEDIAFKNRLRLSIAILVIWTVASFVAMTGFGTSEKPLACLINAVVGVLGLAALAVTYYTKPERGMPRPPKA